ncbi:MAG TPA: ATP-binding protein [Ignavibacteriaceae bacterium]|nr:ATP-binding protein [Ignavibacteriaceae bacterium]
MIKVNKLFRWLSIKSKLIIAFVGLSILPIIVLSIYSIISTTRKMDDTAIRDLNHDLTLIQENTANLLANIGQDLQLIQNTLLTPQVKASLGKQDEHLNENLSGILNNELLSFVNTKKIYFQIKILDNSAIEKARVESQLPYGINNNYKIVPKKNLKQVPQLYYLLLAKNMPEGNITIAPAELRSPDNKLVPVVSFVMPVFNNDKETGILIADVFVRNLFKTLQTYKSLTPDEKVILVSGDGHYLYHSDKKNDWNKLLAAKDSVNLKNDYPEVAEELLSDKKGVVTDKTKDIIIHTPLFYNYPPGHHINVEYKFAIPLYLFAAIPKSVILTTIHRYEITFSGIVLLFLLISIALSLLATRHFTSSLSTLSKGAETITRGNYNYRVKIETRDELENLADQFNLMAKSLGEHETEIQQYKTHLEEMVNSRTKELLNEKSKLQTILDNVPSAFLVLDRDLNIQTASEAIKKITGYHLDSLLGKNCGNVFDKKGFCEKCICRNAISTNRIQTTVNRKIDENNRERYIEHIAIPINKDGKVNFVLSVITDITKRKQLENFLIKTERLAATGEIAAYVAHEFRNSLTSIKMILQLITESKNLSRSEKKSLGVALNSIGEMEDIVSRLLNFANPGPLNFQETGLDKIIEESINFVQLNLKNTGIKITKHIYTAMPVLFMDIAHFKEAFINILFNAIHSIEEKSNHYKELNKETVNEIEISVSKIILNDTLRDYKIESSIKYSDSASVNRDDYEINLQSGTECLLLQIADTGIGIDEEILSRIFDPFFTTKINGTGLGLPMVKRTINSHGGIINVESKKWIGTRFKIYIPLTFKQNTVPSYI